MKIVESEACLVYFPWKKCANRFFVNFSLENIDMEILCSVLYYVDILSKVFTELHNFFGEIII